METIKIEATQTPSHAALWTGRIISALCILFLLADGIMKIFREAHHVQGTTQLGFSESFVQPLGITLTLCTILYTIPRTAILGAILLTGYLGGATATMVHAHQPLYFPLIFGVLVWAGLYFRDSKLRTLIPLRKD
ncbi:DoxX family protein [Ohtaekwangia sp.]|uniref:DoxX family protein n=1 Tax=Ohtaekwangia sp. TaxID=2066019 RepID=UPI002FDE5FCE